MTHMHIISRTFFKLNFDQTCLGVSDAQATHNEISATALGLPSWHSPSPGVLSSPTRVSVTCQCQHHQDLVALTRVLDCLQVVHQVVIDYP